MNGYMKLTTAYTQFTRNNSVSFGTKIQFSERDSLEPLRNGLSTGEVQFADFSTVPQFHKQTKNDILTLCVMDCHAGILVAENGDTYMFHNMPNTNTNSVYQSCLEDKFYGDFKFLPKIRSAVIIGGMRHTQTRDTKDSVPLAEKLEEVLRTKFGAKDVTRMSDFDGDNNIFSIDMHYSKDNDTLTVFTKPFVTGLPDNEKELGKLFSSVKISKADRMVFDFKRAS